MPQHLIHAFLAAEDRNFFNHSGISIRGIARSMMVNIYHRRMKQGASTITQQLIRLLYFEAKKTFKRKLQEQLLALVVEKQFTKEQILETYLNHICFGRGIYGVQAAAAQFWGLNIHEINEAQSAALAAIVRNPNYYCPLNHPENTLKRRNIILNIMHEIGYLKNDRYCELKNQPLNLIELQPNNLAPHLQESIRLDLEKMVGREKLYSGGLKVQTTINQNTQRIAQKAFHKQLDLLKQQINPEIDGGLITLDVKSGEVKALIGGYDFSHSQFNRATQARHQLGSIIKPIIYASALEQGACLSDVEIDEPITIANDGNKWEPRNSNRQFEGPMTFAYALSHSNNIVTIKTLLKYGIEKSIDFVHKMGITQDLPPYPSLALGCVDVTLLQATGTFNTFANNGTYVKPHYIKWIKDEWGTKIWRHKEEKTTAISSKVTDQIIRVLTLSLKRISEILDISLPFEAFYKTGTTNDSRNCWIVGSTTTHTTGIYIGTDNNQSLGANIFAIRTAFPIWHELNEAIGSNPSKFPYNPYLKEITINSLNGKPVQATHKDAISILVKS